LSLHPKEYIMSRLSVRLLCVGIAVLASLSFADEPKKGPVQSKDVDPNDPAHKELIDLREAVKKAINSRDIDGLLKYLHPNVVIVWQNGEVSRKHQGVRDYYEKYLGRPESVLAEYTVEPKVAELTILYGGDTGISYGTTESHFKFKSGRTLDVNGPWDATLVKEDGRWQIASLHASVGLFDNPLVGETTRTLYWGCAIAAVVGLVVGALLMALVRRRRAA
jgi:ketosteroid isomerase-like protein